MAFIKVHKKLTRAASLAVVVTALTVTACGGGSGAALAQGAPPGQWTKAETSQFTAVAGTDGSGSQDSCIAGYFERDMSFGNAMAVVSVAPASGPSRSDAQIKAALVKKYGAAGGDAVDAQFERVEADSVDNCGSAGPSSAPAAAPAPTEPTASPAATSESSCTVDCVNPVASGESGWLAQVQGALQNVQQDLSSISSDSGSDPASQAITAGNAALASFNAANGGVLNGTIQS
jgi:hypothetical protein